MTIEIRPLRRNLSPDEAFRLEKSLAALLRIRPEDMARAAAPALNDFGVRQSLAWSNCASSRDFGMVIRGHIFTIEGSTSLVLKPRFLRVLTALVVESPVHRQPDVIASLFLKLVAADLFLKCCETSIRE